MPQAASYLNVSEETVRRNIGSRRLKAIRKGTQWLIEYEVLALFANSYDSKTGPGPRYGSYFRYRLPALLNSTDRTHSGHKEWSQIEWQFEIS